MNSHHADRRSRGRARGRHLLRWSRYLPGLVATVAAASSPLHADNARSAGTPTNSPPGNTAGAKLGTVTIEAARARKELERRVQRFVFSLTVHYMYESLPRWDEPICPLVAGLPRQQGEYILARLSQVAAAAHAPLAGEHCKANLFVVATPFPDLLLRKWWARDKQMYNTCDGVGGIERYLHSKQPVRVWYNTSPGNQAAIPLDALTALSPGASLACASSGGAVGTRLAQDVLALSQAFVIVDTRQTKSLTIGQLADYVSVVGLAQIQTDTHSVSGPSILTLFEAGKHPPEGLTGWDRALLYALYHTRQSSSLQVPIMERSMVSQILSAR